MQTSINDLLACARFALRPVACGISFFVSPETPNLTGGGGPVFCGIRGAGVFCCGIGGTGGGLKFELYPLFWFCIPVGVGCRAGGRNELIPVC